MALKGPQFSPFVKKSSGTYFSFGTGTIYIRNSGLHRHTEISTPYFSLHQECNPSLLESLRGSRKMIWYMPEETKNTLAFFFGRFSKAVVQSGDTSKGRSRGKSQEGDQRSISLRCYCSLSNFARQLLVMPLEGLGYMPHLTLVGI